MRALCAVLLLCWQGAAIAEPIVVGSKRFTESYVLAEIIAQTLERGGYDVVRQFGFGGTLICFEALAGGEIDVYPEYTGTLARTVLRLGDGESMDAALARRGLQALPPFGFDNTYALAVTTGTAAERGLARVSDLADHPDLRVALSHEFLNRDDGWPGLSRAYGLDLRPTGIDHGLAYQALAQGRIDVTDAYVTDGDIPRYELTLLADDRGFFPDYLAVPLAGRALPDGARTLLEGLAGRIDDATMRALNARVMADGAGFDVVAAEFLGAGPAGADGNAGDTLVDRLTRNTLRHLKLTAIALATAAFAGIGLALLVWRSGPLSRAVLYVTGLLQTIPSIALLALMIPLFGVGQLPAVIALFLYSLLPIVRSTVTALQTIAPLYRQVARAMGLSRREQMRHVLMPLAMPNLLTGIRTAAIISIGTATLAAFIGAGGLGDPIVTGLALNDTSRILEGAIPAAILAIMTELFFEALERRLVPAHLVTQR